MTLGLLLGMIALLPQPVADQTCLAATVYMEARSQPTRGQLAVAEVALDRLDMGRYGGTICDVVTAPHQFALTTTSKSFRISNQKAWNKAWEIAGQAIAIWNEPSADRKLVVPGANHFIRLGSTATWARNPIATIGDHEFYAVD
ncbi:MAG TPA: cell wall hydrolase [Rhodanobacteraceae bacterium]|jgi:spore germination cell wall hydrolase CwlJ-like protein|nr:cell wall hydrolase [Rhodanobacteraceae bacterium]